MIPALLIALAIVDAAFAGFRASAGRNARIRKAVYYRDALLRGAASGACLVLALALATAAVLAASGAPGAVYADLLAIGERMLRVFAAYAVLVLAALLVYGTARAEIRTLATVAILGPFTLLRPWVIAVATVFGIVAGRSPSAIGLTLGSSTALWMLGKGLDRWYGRLVEAEIAAVAPQAGTAASVVHNDVGHS